LSFKLFLFYLLNLLLSKVCHLISSSDSYVSCVVMESCILPCSFQGGTDVVIHWIQVTAGNLPVHSFYHNQDQLGHQDQHRTSLFKDQISRGNASLQLTGVEVQDQGRYKCHTSVIRGNKDSFINLKLDVDLQQVDNRITCSSEGIYPEPELTWSTSPPSSLNLQHKTTKQKTEQLLYNIRSYLILSDSDLGYSCTVSTRRNRKRATLWRLCEYYLSVEFGIVLAVVIAAVVLVLVLCCIKKKGKIIFCLHFLVHFLFVVCIDDVVLWTHNISGQQGRAPKSSDEHEEHEELEEHEEHEEHEEPEE
uniref:Ig-like domain-containing protein n=1 Tax=Seriola lalandi dorsalis TaxID=1841481 RepID=A0A3B4YYM0_SERLL